MSQKKGTSACLWIGCGCALCVLLIIGLVGGVGFAGFNWLTSMVDDMADPQARTVAALDMLGAETLPPGYHARAFFSIPFIMKLVILSDGEAPEAIEGETFEDKAEQLGNLVLRSDQVGNNTLIYLNLRSRNPGDTIEDIVSGGGSGQADVDLGIEFEMMESLADGQLDLNGQNISWRAYRGEMEAQGGTHEGIAGAVTIECPGGELHDLLWFQVAESASTTGSQSAESQSAESSSAEAAAAEGSLASQPSSGADDLLETPADPEAIKNLLGYFGFCR